jgi:hypothetical protein
VPGTVAFEVTVVRVGPGGEGVQADPRARQIDRLLREKVRYHSLRVLSSSRRTVDLDEIVTVNLPDGTRFRFRTLDVGERGVLVAVDMDRSARGDFRIPRGKPLVVGGSPFEDGQLVVVLEPTR